MCTKEMHFTFDGKVYQQTDGVCMGSPLGPVLANVFMVHLEETIAPTLQDAMPEWRRYVDDTFTVVKKGRLDDIITTLNNFHPNISFTHEIEEEGKMAFLDVLIMKEEDGGIQTGVYRKATNNSIYIHWNSYAPKQWKIGTLSGMIRRAYEICSNEDELKKELTHLKRVFTITNGYPQYLVSSVMEKTKKEQQQKRTRSTTEESEDSSSDDLENQEKTVMLKVPYAGEKGVTLLKDLKKELLKNLPENIKCRVVQTGTKLSRNFNIKDKIDQCHLSNFIYRRDCKNKKCNNGDYIGETSRRKVVRTEEHSGKDKQSWIYKHSATTKHPRAKDEDFEILASNYPDRRRRKLAEAMYIRDLKPSLNQQKESYKLVLFN